MPNFNNQIGGKPKNKSQNPWMIHLANYWKVNKGKMTYKQAMLNAKKTYKKK
jgi:hypothetical protein